MQKGLLPAIRQGRSIRIGRKGLDALHRQSAGAVKSDADGISAFMFRRDQQTVEPMVRECMEAAFERVMERTFRHGLMGQANVK